MSGRSRADLVEDAKSRVRQIPAADVLRDRSSDMVLLDVREPKEWNLAHIPGAMLIPLAEVEEKVGAIPQDSKVVVYCATGNRSAVAADMMQQMGYSDVASMAGGIRDWADAGGEVE